MHSLSSDEKKKVIKEEDQRNINVIGNTTNPDIYKRIIHGNKDLLSSTPENDFVLLDLGSLFFLHSIRITFWCWDTRIFTYNCFISEDGESWFHISENMMAQCNETIVVFRQVRFIKLQGKSNADAYLQVVDFKLN